MVRVRWIGVGFGLLQVFTYYIPHPPGTLAAALSCVAPLASCRSLMPAMRKPTSPAESESRATDFGVKTPTCSHSC